VIFVLPETRPWHAA